MLTVMWESCESLSAAGKWNRPFNSTIFSTEWYSHRHSVPIKQSCLLQSCSRSNVVGWDDLSLTFNSQHRWTVCAVLNLSLNCSRSCVRVLMVCPCAALVSTRLFVFHSCRTSNRKSLIGSGQSSALPRPHSPLSSHTGNVCMCVCVFVFFLCVSAYMCVCVCVLIWSCLREVCVCVCYRMFLA